MVMKVSDQERVVKRVTKGLVTRNKEAEQVLEVGQLEERRFRR
jgi:hypothetical protein